MPIRPLNHPLGCAWPNYYYYYYYDDDDDDYNYYDYYDYYDYCDYYDFFFQSEPPCDQGPRRAAWPAGRSGGAADTVRQAAGKAGGGRPRRGN